MGIASLLMQSEELSSDALESIKLIMASSTLLLNLVNNLLDVKKATSKSKKNRSGIFFGLASSALRSDLSCR